MVVDIAGRSECFDTRWWFTDDAEAAPQMRRFLAEYRCDGLSFEQAWPLAMARVRFSSWRAQKEWLKAWEDPGVMAAWRAGYEGKPHVGTLAVARLMGMHGAVAYPESQAVAEFSAHEGPQL